MHPDRWEVGSFFHWMPIPPSDHPADDPWSGGVLLSSGRDALRMALAQGARDLGWHRLWVPDYFCQQVVSALIQTGYQLMSYPDHPMRPDPTLPDARPGDAVLVMNYFGTRERITSPAPDGVGLIEDHSHDPVSGWARTSEADFCIASLRKTVPIPDGGTLWSPRQHAIPRRPRLLAQRRRTSAAALQAMVMKGLYLDGHELDKSDYRTISARAESDLSTPLVSSATTVSRAVLSAFPHGRWRAERRRNLDALREHLAEVDWVQALTPDSPDTAPFSAALVFDSPQRRETVRARLLAARVFPALLWSLEQPHVPVSDASLELSRRMLSIACDARYGPSDMARVAEAIRA